MNTANRSLPGLLGKVRFTRLLRKGSPRSSVFIRRLPSWLALSILLTYAAAQAARATVVFSSFDGGTQTFSAGTTFSIDSPTPFSPAPQTLSPVLQGSGGQYGQFLINGFIKNSGTPTSGVISFSASSSFTINNDSTFSGTGAYATEKFYIVRTDGHMWPNSTVTGLGAGTYQYIDGTLTGFSNITISKFSNLPTLPSGLQWEVESTSAYIKLYIGSVNGVAQGNGVWLNGGADQKWTTNTSSTNNWGSGQPSSAGEIATFNNTVINYASGIVNVDQPQTIGGISLSNTTGGGYTIGVNGGNALTLDNVTNDGSGNLTVIDPTIVVISGTHTIAAPLVIADGSASGGVNGLAVTVAGGAQLTVSGTISSGYNIGNNLGKFGAGTLVLEGANTYTGSTTVNAGTLNLLFGPVTSSNILPSTSALVLSGGTLSLTGTVTSAQTVNGLTTTAGTGSQILLGGPGNETLTLGALTSAGANSALNFNTVAGGANGATVGTGVIVLTGQTAGAVINPGFTVSDAGGFGLATVNGSNDVVRLTTTNLLPPSGAVSSTNYTVDNNAGGSAANGSSSLVVTTSESANSVTVDTTAASGILTLNSGVVFSNNTWNFGGNGSNSNTYQITGGTLQSVASGGSISFNNYNNGAVTIASPILANGVNAVYFNGTGTTILTGANTYTGGTTLSGGGTLQVGVSSTTSGSGATMAITNGATGTGLVTVNSGTLDLSTFNLAVAGLSGGSGGTIASSSTNSATPGSLTIVATGTQTYSGVITNTTGGGNQTVSVTVAGSGTQILAGANTYTGATTVTSGTLGLTGSLTGSNVSTSGSGIVSEGATGVIAGSGVTFTQGSSGTTTLSGTNTYTGATTVNNGTLALGSGGSISNTSQVTVNSGGTLLMSGNNNINNGSANVTLNGGTIAVGASGNSQTFGTLTLSATSTINFSTYTNNTLSFANSSSLETSWSGNTLNIYNWTPADSLYVGSDSSGLTSTQLSEIDFYSGNGSGFLGEAKISSAGLVTPVPEPSSVLVGLSLLSLAAYRERRRFLRCKAPRETRTA